jgi:hypothetical protein
VCRLPRSVPNPPRSADGTRSVPTTLAPSFEIHRRPHRDRRRRAAAKYCHRNQSRVARGRKAAPNVAGTLRVPSAPLCAQPAAERRRHTECACYVGCGQRPHSRSSKTSPQVAEDIQSVTNERSKFSRRAAKRLNCSRHISLCRLRCYVRNAPREADGTRSVPATLGAPLTAAIGDSWFAPQRIRVSRAIRGLASFESVVLSCQHRTSIAEMWWLNISRGDSRA